MRRRLTLAFVAVLAVALILAGGVSLLLVRHAVSVSAQATVLRQARALRAALRDPATGSLVASESGLRLFESLAGLEASQAIVVDKKGAISPPPAPGSVIESVNGRLLARGESSSGVHNHVAFAAVPVVTSSVNGSTETVALVFEAKESFSSASIWYFLVASGVSLLAAAAIASLLGSRVASRVDAVANASERIAAGDLSTRVEVGTAAYPELVRLDRALNQMAESLEHAREGERAFLLSISHDLRTPLTSILGYAEAIADGAVPDLQRAARVVVSEAARLERLIGDLLDLARLRADQFSFEEVELDLAGVVRQGAEAFLYEFEAADVALALRCEEPIRARVDPHRVGQIVANLTENALKFARDTVEVSLAREGAEAVLAVTDDGPGIAAKDLPHVFEWLYSAARDTARSAGTGLGLAIVTELSRVMGAAVAVQSPVADGRGTRFEVRFPLVQEPGSGSTEARSSRPSATSVTSEGGSTSRRR